ncbi:MAG: TonB C-terminal domain-containing protein, partial [Deltaproteobacteria bacterium]|nr:TonB C-terminal domain-containing protein [Deltaproteobacteria bacterium]
MTGRHSILSTQAPEARLRWLIGVSLIVHALLFALFLGKPHESSEKIFFQPAYTVSLVELPADSRPRAGAGRNSKMTMWKGPAPLESQVKTQTARKHPILTIPKKKNAPEAESAAQTAAGQHAISRPQSTLRELRLKRYYQAVWNKIKSAWILPDYGTSPQQLEAIVLITINRNGTVVRSAFEKKSGNSHLDRSVIRA